MGKSPRYTGDIDLLSVGARVAVHGSCLGPPALLEPIALPVHLQDMDTVRETVEECSGEPLRAEDFGPLVEGKVGRDQYGATLVALAEDLEEQLGSGLGQGHEAELVDDDEFEARQLLL